MFQLSQQPSHPLFLLPLVAGLGGCFLFGGSSGSRSGPDLPVEAVDSVEAYTQHLRAHPDDQSASRYQQRLAELELIQARSQLRPVLQPEVLFAAELGGEPFAPLSESVRMIFDSQDDGWFGFQVVQVSPSLERPVTVFARDAQAISLSLDQEGGQAYFSVQDPAGLALVHTSSFDLQVHQLAVVGGGRAGGMRLCFFSQEADSCDNGYEFTYDSAHFQTYQLARKTDGESSPLCQYQMDTNNTAHSDSITVDPSTRDLRNPEVRLSAHNGHLVVTFNGHQLCHVQDQAHAEGYFVLADTPAITKFDLRLNAGSAPVYASADVLADVPQAGDPLSPRGHALYEDYDAFVADYNAYLAVVAGGDFPESFHHAYFDSFFGSAEAKDAYLALEGSTTMEDYTAYLEAYPRNPYKREIEKLLYRLAKEEDSAEAYQTFLDHYPQTVTRLDVRRRIADLQWSQIVKKSSAKYLNKYLSQYPEGYYTRRAGLLLEGLEYQAKNKAEVSEAQKAISQAQKLVDQSPVTAPWDVAVIDYQAGSIYYNLNDGPVIKEGSHVNDVLYFVTHDQTYAHNNTCDLLKKNIPAIGFCLVLFSRDHVSPHAPFPVEEAIQDTLDGFYLSRIERGETVNMTRVLELLDEMASSSGNMAFEQHAFLAQTYGSLGMSNEATYTLYTFAMSRQKRSDVSYMAKKVLEKAPGLAQDPDFQWVLSRFGE